MSDKTAIEWTDATWNPVTGCTQVSPGCDNCYALTLAERFRGTPGHYFQNGFDVQLRPDKLDQPLRWKRPRKIFVNSMSDVFHEEIPDDYIAQIFAVMALAAQHTFQLLTKRHGRMRNLMKSEEFRASVLVEVNRLLAAREWPLSDGTAWPLPNVWLGVSVEDQKWANIRIPALLATPAAKRFLSCEPLLGSVSMFDNTRIDTGTLVDWVIVGGESGHGARPMHPGWAYSLRDECIRYGIPFHFKQWGSWGPVVGNPRTGDVWFSRDNETTPWHTGDGHVRVAGGLYTNDGRVLIRRGNKHDIGRALDGRTWDEFPSEVAA